MQGDKYSVPSKTRTLFQVREWADGVLGLAGSVLALLVTVRLYLCLSENNMLGESLFASLNVKRSSGMHMSSAL